MGKPHPIELRERVVGFVEEGNTHRAAAAHFRVSIKFVNDMVRLKRQTGSLAPKRQGNPGWSKVGPYEAWVRQRLEEQGDLTQEAVAQALRDGDYPEFCARAGFIQTLWKRSSNNMAN